MVRKLKDIKNEIACGQIRVSIVALFCLTVIALASLVKMSDPENVIINIVIAIMSFSGGVAAERLMAKRKTDKR